MIGRWVRWVLLAVAVMGLPLSASAHHVLGRPAYSVNDDGRTPPSMQVETQIGKYFVTIMAFPAFPRPGELARVKLYATRLSNGEAFVGKVAFSVRDDVWLPWLAEKPEPIGTQMPNEDDKIFTQGFVANRPGDYIVTATYESDGEPYIIDLPMRIGEVTSVAPIVLAGGGIFLVLGAVAYHKRARRRASRRENSTKGDPAT